MQQQPKHKIDYSYQELGIEIEDYFKTKRGWALFHKVGHTEALMRYALKECKTRGISNINYFITIINNVLNPKPPTYANRR